ncbi:MAG: PstC family ABC transporter permease, partial [Thermocrispum sp.]
MPTSEQTGPRDPVRARPGDRVFSGLSTGAGVLILVVLAGVATFLLVEAWPALVAPSEEIPGDRGIILYIWPLLFGTLLSAVLALFIAAPLAVAIALFITHYAPRRIAQTLGYLVDLLAAVPSIIYGLWGIAVLAPATVPATQWLSDNLGWIPLFAGPPSATGRTMLVTSVVLAVMVLPIITAVVREAFLQTPRLHEEASLALGATHWEMIKMAVLPFGRSAIVGASMLGLGRALG